MRLHTNATESDIRKAGIDARVDFATLSTHGSRKSARAFEVNLTGASSRRPNRGDRGADGAYAATWDQWGVFLAAIFAVDPEMSCWAYTGAEDFHAKTAGRFADGWPEDAHGDHKWEFARARVQSCTRCSAEQDHSWIA